jgi:hypothetical protein
VDKYHGKAPNNETKKKSKTETVQQGLGIFNQYIDRQVYIDDAIKKMQKREKTHEMIIVNSRKSCKPPENPLKIINDGWKKPGDKQ